MLCLSEAGSGKTLSFILPVLNYLYKNKSVNKLQSQGSVLILAPTR